MGAKGSRRPEPTKSSNESEATCEAAVCSGNAEISDPVEQGHGAWGKVNDYLPNASTEDEGQEGPPEGEDEEGDPETEPAGETVLL